MATTTRAARSAEEIAALMKGYADSGLSRREYSRQVGIPVTTLDYYRQRQAKKENAPGLLAVKIDGIGPASAWVTPLVLALANGRRIEVRSGFRDEELARLVRVAEQA